MPFYAYIFVNFSNFTTFSGSVQCKPLLSRSRNHSETAGNRCRFYFSFGKNVHIMVISALQICL